MRRLSPPRVLTRLGVCEWPGAWTPAGARVPCGCAGALLPCAKPHVLAAAGFALPW